MGLAMMSFLHLYLKYTQPLFIQGLMGLKNAYDARLVQIYIFGKPAEGDLKRPFKTSGGFFSGAFSSSLFCHLLAAQRPFQGAGGEPATDKAAIDEAEKKVGPKKDE